MSPTARSTVISAVGTWTPTTSASSGGYVAYGVGQAYPRRGPSPQPAVGGPAEIRPRSFGATAMVVFVVQDLQLARAVKGMIDTRAQIEQATRSLRDGLMRVPQVKTAFLRQVAGGLQLWAVIAEPFYEAEGRVIEEYHAAVLQFRQLELELRLIRQSASPHVRPRTDDITLFSR